jgi:hypothetical protein
MTAARQPLLDELARALAAGEPIRRDFGRGERLHIDRPLPFLVVHIGQRRDLAAVDVASANSAYLLVRSLRTATAIIKLVAEAMRERFGAFIVIDVGELERDRLASDADYLPPRHCWPSPPPLKRPKPSIGPLKSFGGRLQMTLRQGLRGCCRGWPA